MIKHVSVPIDSTCTFIDMEKTKFSPLIQKVQIKVCYVSDEPNRNGSVITREVAEEMAPTLRGCPIVGFYNKQDKDFEAHNVSFDIDEETGEFVTTDETKAYGFVDLNANVWFQKFEDDGAQVREYLMTEGYIWKGQYPEVARVALEGNNQSMELDSESLEGFWSENINNGLRIFIINRAIISKLCILGENYEPCFEGAQIRTSFSLNESFEKMVTELSYMLNKGGNEEMHNNTDFSTSEENTVEQVEETVEVVEPAEGEATDNTEVTEENVENFSQEEGQNFENISEENSENNEEENISSEAQPVEEPVVAEESVEERYALNEITSEMLQNIPAFIEYQNTTSQQIDELTQFKKNIERQEKMQLINSFYVLSDEEKRPFVENIDKYSYHELEGELSIICVRNKVNFNDVESNVESAQTTYNLVDTNDDDAPEWIKSVREVSKKM